MNDSSARSVRAHPRLALPAGPAWCASHGDGGGPPPPLFRRPPERSSASRARREEARPDLEKGTAELRGTAFLEPCHTTELKEQLGPSGQFRHRQNACCRSRPEAQPSTCRVAVRRIADAG